MRVNDFQLKNSLQTRVFNANTRRTQRGLISPQMNADKHRYQTRYLSAKNAKDAKALNPIVISFFAFFVFFADHYSCLWFTKDTGLPHSHTFVRNKFVVPAETGIQRLKSLDSG